MQLSVADFGARGDGVTDDTAAIQAALDSAARGNRSVYLPFREMGYVVTQLVVPPRVCLWSDVTGYFKQGAWNKKTQRGEVTWIKCHGQVNTPAIVLSSGSALEGVLVVDPRQKFGLRDDNDRFNETQYGVQLGDESAMRGGGLDGIMIRDVGFIGNTKFIVQYKNARSAVPVITNLHIQRVYGAVVGTGIEIYHTSDVCWAYDVQFNMNAWQGLKEGDRVVLHRVAARQAVAFKLGRADGFNIVSPQVMHCKHFIHFFPNSYNGDRNKGGGCRVVNAGIDVVHVPILVEGRSSNGIGLMVSNTFMLPLFHIPGKKQAALVLKDVRNFKAQFSNITLSWGGARSFTELSGSKYFGRSSVKWADYAVHFDGNCSNCVVNIAASALVVGRLSNASGSNAVNVAACDVGGPAGRSEDYNED